MKTKKCKYCQEEIAKNVKTCPKCGGKFGLPTFVKFLIVILIIIVCIVGCVSSCSKSVSDSIDETTNSYKDKNGKTSFKLNETFENSHIRLTMTEANVDFKGYSEYATVKPGYKVLAAKFEVENIGNDEEYVSYLDFDAYADETAIEDFYYADDKYPQIASTISKGKKASGYVFYEVPKDASKITIEYKPSAWENVQIEFVVK